jgi:uncharacterized protein YaeQ
MALPSTIYRASITLAGIDRGRYELLPATVARHPSETAERLVARLLAYALCFEEGLAFTRGIAAGDEPDLWLKGPDGRVQLWVEVGLPEAERLVKAARHAQRVVLFACGSGRPRWEEAHLPKFAAACNLTIYGLDWPFLQQAAACLERVIDWSLTVSGGTLYLTVAGETLEAPLAMLKGPGEG